MTKQSPRQALPLAGIPEAACCPPLASEPLSAGEAAELAPLFKAIGDPARLRLLSLIASHPGGETCVCDLTGAFDLTAPTISHHLRVLREAGLIESERRGTWVYYWVSPGMLARMSALLAPETLPAAPQALPAAPQALPARAGPGHGPVAQRR